MKVQFPSYEELVNKFLNFNLESLNDVSDKIVNKFDNGKLFPPYVPFVGNNYQSTKILIYAMAQNLDRNFVSKTYGSNFSEKQLVERLKYGWNPADFIEKEAKFYNIKIEPYRVGILPSLAGINSQIHIRMRFETLDEVHNNIAVSNYYKLNYHQEKTKKQKSKDINPNSLNPEDYKEYFRINDELVKLELDTLKPELIMLFNGRHKEEIENWKNSRGFSTKIERINDPSWIRWRTKSCLTPQGSWGKIASELGSNNPLYVLVKNYMNEIKNIHQKELIKAPKYKGSIVATEIYLLKYASDWIRKLT